MDAWSYLVVSTDRQAETLDDQRAWSRGAALAGGWTITRTFEGVSSGRDGTRKLLMALLDELRATPKRARPARVLLIRIDRLGRGDGLDAIAAIAEIRRLGVILHTRQDGDVALGRATESVLPVIQVIVAGIENDVRSDKWKAVHARRRAAGLHVGYLPFGCALDAEGRAIVYEPEAWLVREIYRKRGAGMGYAQIARWAASQGLKTKLLAPGKTRPIAFSVATIRSLLKARAIRRLVVDELDVARADAKTKALFHPRAPRRYAWPLSGALRCACGKMLAGHASESRGKLFRYLLCRDHPGGAVHHRASDVEASFQALLERLASDPGLVHRPASKNELSAARARLAEIERQERSTEAKMRAAWDAHGEGAATATQLRERLAALEGERGRLRAEADQLRASVDHALRAGTADEAVGDALVELAHLWPVAPTQERQTIARAVAEISGDLWLTPEKPGIVVPGFDIDKVRMSDDLSKIATSAQAVLAVARALKLSGLPSPGVLA